MNKIFDRTQKEINRDRRRFLDMISKAGVSTSILKASSIAGGIFASRFAEAQSNQPKLVCIFQPNGSPDGNWAPGRSVATRPLEPHSSNIAFREMTINTPGNHGNIFQAMGATAWGRESNGSSYNIQVAKVIGNTTPYSSLELGVETAKASDFINKLDGQAIPLEANPSTAFNRIFSSVPSGGGGGGGGDVDTSAFDKRLSVLDANKAALAAIQNKLGSHERDKLEAHLSALEELERKVNIEKDLATQDSGGGNNGGGGSCSAPNLTTGNSPLATYKAQADIAATALSCGLTNVVSIQFNHTQADWYANDGTADAVPWNQDHHQANHANGNVYLPQLIEYMNKGTAHLIDRLKALGIFNNTVVVQVSEMGDGQNHTTGDGPIIVATGRPGLQSGYRRDGASHLGIFNDVTSLLGLQSSAGGQIHRYGGGGHVA